MGVGIVVAARKRCVGVDTGWREKSLWSIAKGKGSVWVLDDTG